MSLFPLTNNHFDPDDRLKTAFLPIPVQKWSGLEDKGVMSILAGANDTSLNFPIDKIRKLA